MTLIKPTIFLKSVNYKKLLQNYKSGNFLPFEKEKIQNVIKSESLLKKELGKDNVSGVFSVKEKSGNEIVIATSSHQNFVEFIKNGNLVKGGTCQSCIQSFDTVQIGYPVKCQEEQFLITENDKSYYKIIYTFWVEGCFCSYECCFYFVRYNISKSYDFRDTILRDSERMLRQLYVLTFGPNSILQISNDPKLLITNNGSLTKEEWSKNNHSYIRSDRIVIIPAKVEYFRQNLY